MITIKICIVGMAICTVCMGAMIPIIILIEVGVLSEGWPFR